MSREVYELELEMQNRELRESQAQLELARARYADLYDLAPVGYCTLDLDARILDLNVAAAALLGGDRQALIGKELSEAVVMEEPRVLEAHLRRCAAERVRVTTELAFTTQDQGLRTMQVISDRIADASGVTVAYRTALVDVSPQKELEIKLRLLSQAGEILGSSLDYEATLEAVAKVAVPALADLCAVDIVIEPGRTTRVAVVFADPVKQRDLADRVRLFAPRPGWATPQARVIETGQPLLLSELSPDLRDDIAHDDVHAETIRAAGVRSLMVVPLCSHGRVLGAISFGSCESQRRYGADDLRLAQDVAGRASLAIDHARLHAEARRAITGRDAVLGVVSHDLRNPLSVILLRTALLMERPAEDDRRSDTRRSVEAIHRSATRMTVLIADLLDVVSLDAAHLSITRSSERLGTIVQDALDHAEALAGRKEIRLVRANADVDLEIECDAARMQQVFGNLLGNAIKFTAVGGTVTVAVVPAAAEVRFEVSDTGAGISAADLPKVFDRFWQAAGTSYLGTGLGLSIAKGIVESHGGRIWVESEEGVGTTFRFTLPRSQTTEAPFAV